MQLIGERTVQSARNCYAAEQGHVIGHVISHVIVLIAEKGNEGSQHTWSALRPACTGPPRRT